MTSSHRRATSRYCSALAKLVAVAALAVVGPLAGAVLADCGDDVAGQRVPCRCGDRVVSDTRLIASDPVVSERCEGDGLLVRVRRGSSSITLNLGGLSISGSGYGTGLRIITGGSQGAVILGGDQGQQAQIVAFDTGMHAHEADGIRQLGRIEFKGNQGHGAWLRCMDAQIFDIMTANNLGDGLRLRGRNVSVTGLESHNNKGAGLVLTGETTAVSGNTHDNAGAGVLSSGKGLMLDGLRSTNNGQPDRREGIAE